MILVNFVVWDNNNLSIGGSLFVFVFFYSEGIVMFMDLVLWLGCFSVCYWCYDIYYLNGFSVMLIIGVVFDIDYDNNSKLIVRL